MTCEYCNPEYEIGGTVFCEELPQYDSPLNCNCGGNLSIVKRNGATYLFYGNTDSVFFTYVDIEDSYQIKFCPMCGSEL